ncbi:MAG: hypothetical protein CK548_08935 [Opitutia bacterium]|nr:MAG: hypothetical protein CK548_08935 [Opitutae bacterium]
MRLGGGRRRASKRRSVGLKRESHRFAAPASLALLLVGPFSGTPVGLTVFAVSSFLKDAVNRIGDLAEDGKPNDSFKG